MSGPTAGTSLLELDANENPLRTTLFPALATLNAGRIELGAEPGLGIDPDWTILREGFPGSTRPFSRLAPRWHDQ